MTRSLACFSVSFSLWLAMAGPAAGQAVVEAGLGAAGAATAAGPAKGIGKSMSGLSVALDKAFKQGQRVSDEQPLAATTAKPAAKTLSTTASASPEPPPNWEDPSGVEAGLGYEELVRRFGPPTMAITNSAGRSLTYRGKDGVFQVEVRDGVVAAIVKRAIPGPWSAYASSDPGENSVRFREVSTENPTVIEWPVPWGRPKPARGGVP